MTIWEEATEFVERLTHGKNLPHFTSCCPGWQKYAETFCPELLSHFSSCKSPIGMNGSLAKTYGAERMGYAPKQVYTVSIMPCIAKKYEGMRPELQLDGMREIDATLTTRELAYLIKEAGIDFRTLPDEERDSLMGESSGAATIFGVTGGVMEAALRYAYEALTGEKPANWDFTSVRGLDGIKEATVTIAGKELRVAVVHGAKRFKKICDQVQAGNSPLPSHRIHGLPWRMRLRWRATCHAVMVWCDESQNDESLRWAQETSDHGEQRLGERMSVHQIGRRGFLKVACP